MPTITLKEALKTTSPRLNLPVAWEWLGGLSRRPVNVMIWGPEGSRKSTLSLQFVNVLSHYGKALVIMSEEDPESGALKQRARFSRINNDRIDLHQVRLFADVEPLLSGEHKYVVVDSVNMLGKAQDFIDLAMRYEGEKSFIFIHQVLQDADKPRDGAKMRHFCDIVIHVSESYKATVQKNRRGVPGGTHSV